MKPATPVTSAFMRRPRARDRAAGTAGRPGRAPRGRCGRWPASSVGRPDDLVGELHAHRRQQRAARPHLDLIVVARRLAVLAVRLDDRQREPVGFHLAIGPARVAEQVGAADLEPDEVVRVVDDAHLVGFGVAHAHPDGREMDGRSAQREGGDGGDAWQRGGLELARGALGIRRAEDRRAGDDDARAGRDDAADVLVIDAAVDLRRAPRFAGAVEQRAHLPDLRLAARNERLAAEAGVHRHDEHEVDVAGDLLERDDRRRRVEDDARLDAERLDGVHGAMQMRQHFDVDRDHRRAGLGEGVDVAIGIGDHQVDVERHRRDPLERPDDRRADRDVRHEVAVHDVDVNQVGAAALDGRDRVAEGREVGREDRRRDQHAHRLTSIEIGSPGADLESRPAGSGAGRRRRRRPDRGSSRRRRRGSRAPAGSRPRGRR